MFIKSRFVWFANNQNKFLNRLSTKLITEMTVTTTWFLQCDAMLTSVCLFIHLSLSSIVSKMAKH